MFKAWASLLSFFLYTSLALSFQITESKFQNRSQIPLKYSGVCPERGDWVEHRSPQRGVWFKHHAPLKHYCCQSVKRNYPPVERARASIQTPAQKQSNIVKCHILFAYRICHLRGRHAFERFSEATSVAPCHSCHTALNRGGNPYLTRSIGNLKVDEIKFLAVQGLLQCRI